MKNILKNEMDINVITILSRELTVRYLEESENTPFPGQACPHLSLYLSEPWLR